MSSSRNEAEEESSILASLVFGVSNDADPVAGAETAAKLAICARMCEGDQALYGQAVRRAVAGTPLTEIFPEYDTVAVIRNYLKTIRRARKNSATLTWMALQFETSIEEATLLAYLTAVERVLANCLIGWH